MPTSSITPLRGIVPPIVTPLEDTQTLDLAGLKRLVEHILSGGVHGIFVLGTTGEGPSLSSALQRQMVEETVRLVAGRVPVLVGITHSSLADAAALGQFAADAGADAVVSSTPYYFPLDQAELFAYIEQLTEQVPLPMLLYNMPRMTKVSFEPETVRQMLQLERVVGIKDSGGDLKYAERVLEIIAQRPDWTLLIGPEHLLAESLEIGAAGGVSGGANLFPRLFVDVYEAHGRGDFQTARSLQEDVLQLGRMLYSVTSHTSAVIKGIKSALSYLGICRDHMALPMLSLQEAERQIVAERLQQIAQLESEGIQTVLKGTTFSA